VASQAERQKAYRERKQEEGKGKRRTIPVPVDLTRKLKGHPQWLVDRYIEGRKGLRKEIEAAKKAGRRRAEIEVMKERTQRAVNLLRSYDMVAGSSKEIQSSTRNRSKLRARVAQLEDQLRRVKKQELLNGSRNKVLSANRLEAEQWGELASRILGELEAEWGSCEEYDVLEGKWKDMREVQVLNRAAMATPGLAP
jgi:hypothetical protein